MDFAVSSRGWCYLLEGEGVITKGQFEAAQRLINDARKNGDLPLNICAVDEKRSADGLEEPDEDDIEGAAQQIASYAGRAHAYYTPFSFWDDLSVYIEIVVEKIDLKNLFASVAREFHIPNANCGGWADINGRAAMMERFSKWKSRGKQCVLLYCGDHDPGGLHISNFLRNNLAELTRSVGYDPSDLIIDRFGLDYDFIEANGLTWIDNLETGSGKRLDDPTHPDFHKPYVQDYLKRFKARKVEANALVTRPREGRELCRQAILKYVNKRALDRYKLKVAAAREELRLAVRRLMDEG